MALPPQPTHAVAWTGHMIVTGDGELAERPATELTTV